MKSNQFNFSVVEYRYDPTERRGAILLGCAIEFTTDDYWVVALGIRDAIDSEELKKTDPLARELLSQPSSLLDNEIRKALAAAKIPGDVLQHLAANNPWAIHVTPPEEAELPERMLESDPSVERMVDKFLFHIFRRDIGSRREDFQPAFEPQRELHPTSVAVEVALPEGKGSSREIPPLWMVPRHWQRPILRRQR